MHVAKATVMNVYIFILVLRKSSVIVAKKFFSLVPQYLRCRYDGKVETTDILDFHYESATRGGREERRII